MKHTDSRSEDKASDRQEDGSGFVPQGQKLDTEQVTNRAGGFTYDVGLRGQLDRWFMLGPGGASGTYYASEREMTRENATVIQKLIDQGDGEFIVKRAIEMRGRVPKVEPMIFALAMVMAGKDDGAKNAVANNLTKICWTGTQFFQFVSAVKQMRGWGRAFRQAVQNWYLSKSALGLAKNLTKYRNREGWRHRDVLLMGHVRAKDPDQNLVLKYIVARDKGNPDQIDKAVAAVMESSSPAAEYLQSIEQLCAYAAEGNIVAAQDLISEQKLPREVLPTQMLKMPETWAALLPEMGGQALLRNLGNLSRVSLLVPGSMEARFVANRISDSDWVKQEHLHPVFIFTAWNTYKQGRGIRSQGEGWQVTPAVVSALEKAFYASFKNVTPIGKPMMLSLDVSGSMTMGNVIGMEGVMPIEAEALMAMVRLKVERPGDVIVSGFDTDYYDIPLRSEMSLDDVLWTMKSTRWGGGTDAAVGIKQALKNGWKLDYFEVHTDNESWTGDTHVVQAMNRYRKEVNPDVRMSVFAYTSTRNTLAKPGAGYMLDVIGFDTAAPDIVSSFARREF